jgi:ParB family chromosome partitioning protein
MAKSRPKVNLTRGVEPHAGDLTRLFSTESDVEHAAGLQLLAIRLEAIEPDPQQPRRSFPADSLAELSESIRQDGLIQPIEVAEVGPGRYKIVHGERRWRAAGLAGLATIPAVVRRLDYDAATRVVRQLVENIQREDLNDVDRAAGLLHLRELLQAELDAQPADPGRAAGASPWAHTITWAKIGKRLGMSRQRIHQLIQLLELPDEIKDDIREGRLTERETRVYQGLLARQQRALHRARYAETLTAAELRTIARHLKESPSKPVTEAIREVRQPGVSGEDGGDEPPFGPSFEGGDAITANPLRPAAGAGNRWVERGASRPQRQAQNINRIHWARDHLSRIQLQELGPAERRELNELLARLGHDVVTLQAALVEVPAAEG